jgi:hypothetical protein
MSMKVVFIKDYSGVRLDGAKGYYNYKALDEDYVPRKFGNALIMNEIAIPEFRKEKHPEYRRLLKEKILSERKEEKQEEDTEKPVKRKYRKKAVSKKAEQRETALLTD